jgi:hypothetical protein
MTGNPQKVREEVRKLGLPVTVLDLVPGETHTLRRGRG